MALLRQLALLLTLGPLALAATLTRLTAVDGPVQSYDDDDDDTPLPLIIWHGLGDNYMADGLRGLGTLAEQVHPGTLVYYVHLGDSAGSDRTATFLGNVTAQVAAVCDAIAADPILSTAPALDALGLSQGGQFLRAYAERCGTPPVRSLVTIGAQHSGISRFVDCAATDLVCRAAMALLRGSTWSAAVQGRVVPAQYFRDPSTPAAYDDFLEHSHFLADVNNERPSKNPLYAARLARLARFAMYLFDNDTTVIPRESSWFADVNGTVVTPLRERPLYTDDWLGLRSLDARGGLLLRRLPGDHLEMHTSDFEPIFKEFFGPYSKFGVLEEWTAETAMNEKTETVEAVSEL